MFRASYERLQPTKRANVKSLGKANPAAEEPALKTKKTRRLSGGVSCTATGLACFRVLWSCSFHSLRVAYIHCIWGGTARGNGPQHIPPMFKERGSSTGEICNAGIGAYVYICVYTYIYIYIYMYVCTVDVYVYI